MAVLFVAAGCSVCASTVGAISFEARDFGALVAEADQIVIGTATASSARRTGPREIVTDYDFTGLEVIKGSASSGSVKLTMLGGTVGHESLMVAGAPTFRRGVRYLVFITGNGSLMFPLVGGHQGVFELRKDAASGASRVYDYAGRAVARISGGAVTTSVERLDENPAEAISETSFVDAIRAQFDEGRAQ